MAGEAAEVVNEDHVLAWLVLNDEVILLHSW